jgi:hypothetical protein
MPLRPLKLIVQLVFIAWWLFFGWHLCITFPCHAIAHHEWTTVADYTGSLFLCFGGPWAIVKALDNSGFFH